jgi:hypothetical protein
MKETYEIRFDKGLNKYRIYKLLNTYRCVRIYPTGDLPTILDRLKLIVNSKIGTETVMHITLEY